MAAPAAGRLRLKDDIKLSWFFLIQNKFFVYFLPGLNVLAISLLILPIYYYIYNIPAIKISSKCFMSLCYQLSFYGYETFSISIIS
jgi:hypothetical protein